MYKRLLSLTLLFMLIFYIPAFARTVTLYNADGDTVTVDEDDADALINNGWFTEPAVTLHSFDGKTILVAPSLVSAYMAMGWKRSYAEVRQTLYAEGKTIEVFKAEVQDYLEQGWFESDEDSKTTLYSEDGRETRVYSSKVSEYEALGWYTVPIARIYTIDGQSQLIMREELPEYEALGWTDKLSDVLINMYSSDGRVIKVWRVEAEAYKQVGWYEKDAQYYKEKPFFRDYGDIDINCMRIGMSYGEFSSIYAGAVKEKTSVQTVDGVCRFSVMLEGAAAYFEPIRQEDINDINLYTLVYITAVSSDYVFGRGFKVGSYVEDIKAMVPERQSAESTYYRYMFDGETEGEYFAMAEELGSISFWHDMDEMGRSVKMYIALDEGVVTGITLFLY